MFIFMLKFKLIVHSILARLQSESYTDIPTSPKNLVWRNRDWVLEDLSQKDISLFFKCPNLLWKNRDRVFSKVVGYWKTFLKSWEPDISVIAPTTACNCAQEYNFCSTKNCAKNMQLLLQQKCNCKKYAQLFFKQKCNCAEEYNFCPSKTVLKLTTCVHQKCAKKYNFYSSKILCTWVMVYYMTTWKWVKLDNIEFFPVLFGLFWDRFVPAMEMCTLL